MRNDTKSQATYERMIKLWISVWKLVLDDKRHLETVCAMLQQIVFGADREPKYKNWPAICKLGKDDRFMMMAVASLDMSRTDEQSQRIIAAFPACFGETDECGPIPLSYIQQLARERADPEGKDGHLFPESYGVLKELSMPYTQFATDSEALDTSLLPLPSFIDAVLPQGSRVEWEGVSWIVAENNQNQGVHVMTIVPAEYIAVDV